MSDKWLEYCLDLAQGPRKLSNKELSALKRFYMAQQALSQELLEAKPLGICKTIISTNPVIGNPSTTNDDSKETLS